MLCEDFGINFFRNSIACKELQISLSTTVKPAFKTTWEIGTTLELRTDTSVPMPIHYIETHLINKTTSEFRTVLHSPFGVSNSQVSLYVIW